MPDTIKINNQDVRKVKFTKPAMASFVNERTLAGPVRVFATCALACYVLVFSGSKLSAAPVLDGVLDAEYFSHGRSYDYESFVPEGTARLYVIDDVSIDPNNIWLVWQVSTTYNDVSYGANKHSTWGGIGHGFGDLLESDKQRIQIFNRCGEIVTDATMDILDSGAPTVSGYDADMDSAESVKTSINGADWTKFDFATSMSHNFNTYWGAGPVDLTTTSPPWFDEPNYLAAAPYAGWNYNLLWEMRVDRSVFVTASCPGGGVDPIAILDPIELHASPSKLGNIPPPTLYRVTSSIGDTVWLDVDRDGIEERGEAGVANVTVALYTDPDGNGDPSDGAVIGTTVTDSNGRYRFTGLGSGDYVVEVTDTNNVLAGWTTTTGGDEHAVTGLAPNTQYDIADFGYAPPTAAIGNYVWSDEDNDGIQDRSEPGIGGVTLDLRDDLGSVVATTTTADDGWYLFTGIAPGDYRVDVTDTAGVLSSYTLTVGPASSSDPTQLITLSADTIYLAADFGYYKPVLGSIGNQIWLDTDEDGQFDAGEEPIGRVSLALIKDLDGDGIWDAGEPVIATALTDVNGQYTFVGLPLDDGGGDADADYLVHVSDVYDRLSLYFKTFGTSPGSDGNSQSNPYAVALSAGSADNVTGDFGYTVRAGTANNGSAEGMIGDRVWFDLDGDGVQDYGEPGVVGVEVELYKAATLIGTVTTDSNGLYYHPHLDTKNAPTVYTAVVKASNFSPGGPLEGMSGTNQPDNTDEGSITRNSPDNVDVTLDFGYWFGSTGYTIGDLVWHDLDADGVRDGGEPGIGGVTLELYDSGGSLLALATTDGSGNYIFGEVAGGGGTLLNGDYTVVVTDDAGVLDGYTNTTGGNSQAVTINNADRDDVDFGYVVTEAAALGDRVWVDVDRDGVQDVGEPGVPGVTVRLYDPGPDGMPGGGDDTLLGSDVTDGSGLYEFTVDAGNYFVEFVAPPGTGFALRDQGGDNAADSDPDPLTGRTSTFAVASGQDDRTVDAGLLPSTLGNFVWLDLDLDGTQDGGEPGILGVTVNVYDPGADGSPGGGDDTLVDTTTTLANGSYNFDLAPGDYFVEFIAPAGHSFTRQDLGGDDHFDSDADIVSGQTIVTSLALAEDDPSWDAGFTNTVALGNLVFADANGDGNFDSGSESGIPGVTVELFNAGDDPASATPVLTTSTDANGCYLFDNIAAGNYFVHVPGAEFQSGGDLLGWRSSPGSGTDDSTDQNADENGLDVANPALTGVSSSNFDLQVGTETTSETAESKACYLGVLPDADVNLTADLGFLLPYDYGDLPEGGNKDYPTAGSGPGDRPRHLLGSGLVLGSSADAEGDGQSSAGADGDGLDEDGVTIPDLFPGRTVQINYTVTIPGTVTDPVYLNAFIDFNCDGDFDDLFEQVATDVVVIDGANTLAVIAPPNALPGDTYARFRISTDAGLGATGDAGDGEVEDYRVTIVPVPGAIGNYVWVDEDSDGLQGAGEPGIPNVRVVLKDGAGTEIASTFTDSQGGYLFTDLASAAYFVDVDETTLPASYSQTTLYTNAGGDFGNKDHSGTGYGIILGLGEVNRTADFGYNHNPSGDVNAPSGSPTAALGDRVWIDTDGDGFQDLDEVGIDGAQLFLVNDPDGDAVSIVSVTPTAGQSARCSRTRTATTCSTDSRRAPTSSPHRRPAPMPPATRRPVTRTILAPRER